jgi:hypothetical protein
VEERGVNYRRQWRKVHLDVDALTLKIRAIDVTDNRIGDAPTLPQLIAKTRAGVASIDETVLEL